MPVDRSFLALLLVSGCTFGVEPVELRQEDSLESSGITLFREDLSHLGALSVRGTAAPTIRAALLARGLISPGEEEAALESLRVELHSEGDVAGVTSSIEQPYAELLDLAPFELEVPPTIDIDLTLGSTSAHVWDVAGLVAIRGASGSVVIEGGDELDVELDSGSIVASARTALLRTSSGSMELVIAEHIDAAARSGSIEARLAGGGAIETDTGSIDIVLEGPLTEDLLVTANDGSVEVHLPPGFGAHLDLEAGDGSVRVDADGVEFGGDSFVDDVGGGGPTIRVRTGDGSIAVDAAR